MKLLFAVFTISAIFISEGLADVYWTKWLDRDNPSGTGDHEQYVYFVADGRRPCRYGYKPVQANCQVVNGYRWYTANKKIRVIYTCTAKGVACFNADQGCRKYQICCPDFEIQYLCYKP